MRVVKRTRCGEAGPRVLLLQVSLQVSLPVTSGEPSGGGLGGSCHLTGGRAACFPRAALSVLVLTLLWPRCFPWFWAGEWGTGVSPGRSPRPGCRLRALHLRGPSWGEAGSAGAQGRRVPERMCFDPRADVNKSKKERRGGIWMLHDVSPLRRGLF